MPMLFLQMIDSICRQIKGAFLDLVDWDQTAKLCPQLTEIFSKPKVSNQVWQYKDDKVLNMDDDDDNDN